MRVLLLNYEYPPAGGGAGFATANIARELAKKGVDVEVLTSRIEDEPDGEIVNGVPIHRVTSWRKDVHDCGLVGAYSYVAFAARKRWALYRKKSYDLEHYFFSLPTGALRFAPIPVRKKPPYIVSLRGSDVPNYDPFNKKLTVMHKLLAPVTQRIWNRANSVVALSDGLRQIARQSNDSLDMQVIPNGIDIEKFRAKTISQASSKDDPLKIITVTRLLERKGVHHLLEAIARPSPLNVTLQIVGSGSYEQELRDRTSELGLTDRVNFTGFVHTDDLPKLYRAADLFALPSMTESFGLVFAEAMACALPIVATVVGGIPELIRSGQEGILVEPGQPEQIRTALEKLLSNRTALIEMGNAGRRRIEQKYTWGKIADRYLEIYTHSIESG
jgi:glycosyltransferase involved in cell wall biosynthesis